ncbi:hypothetical protein LPJ55_004699 [Coemansia sp. RSA 990]|nr:hypothetical protein BX667DRAFT_493288 [Coemansia mojavensis]KAJ1739987.1 hypothetical protein LPJ68_004180 [Coemansia sp. RSA 1086]KAJ1747490.1 hypothetical protein LPJ79_005211 [Coemansia sp. RSA 1821]KAJ1870381.1 hypothetical protein LPJ55_004699 [Coemansia sp. RSA 990]KAJ2668234.1 hypothetical protein IWW42_005355 [Coemansia sp. RSA 1085]
MVANSRRRSGAPRFNVGTTLQTSMAVRRRSTAATANFLRPRMPAEQQAEPSDIADTMSYNLDELFDEDESPPQVARASSSEVAKARLNMLSAARADENGSLQPPPTRRQMFGMYLDASPAGRRWDQVDALINTAIACLHVYNTTHLRPGRINVPRWSLMTQAVLSLLLLIQFVPRYMLAPDPLEYMRSLFSIITLVTALTPICVVANIALDPSVYYTFMSSGSWVFLYPVIFWRLQPALLRCLVPIKNIYRLSPMTRNVLRALTTVFTTVLAITVLTHTMVYYQNPKDDEIQGFDEAFFFIAVSAITGLSSDIEPDTWFTRTVVLFVMFIGIFWLPPRVSEMLSLWQDRSPWPHYFEAEANQMHVLVIGDLEYTTLFEFLREFFCEDHGIRTVNTVVVVMSETAPGKEVTELLHDPSYVNRVKFVLGSPTSFKQLHNVQAHEAQAVFLLSSKASAADAAKEDAAKVMVALAIRKFLRSQHGYSKRPIPIYAQVLLPETTVHMEYLAEHVICIEELRLGLLAKSVMVPGFASLLQLLTSTIPSTITDPLIRTAKRSPGKAWLAEYAQSMSHEIYATRIPALLHGSKFPRASQLIFQRTGAALFALHIPGREDQPARMVINPKDYELQGDELGFVIAANSLITIQIAYLTDSSTVDVDEDESTPLLASALPADSNNHEGSSDRRHAHSEALKKVLADPLLQPKVPFGMNVMDTLVVSDAARSIREDPEHSESRSELHAESADNSGADNQSVKSRQTQEQTSEQGNMLMSEFADIEVEENKSKGHSSDSESSGLGGSTRMQRAPLVFDPALHKKPSDTDVQQDEEEDGRFKAPDLLAAVSGKHKSALAKADSSKPTPDGLPGNLSRHVVVCDTSDEFPSNIVYLVSCIRSAAPSEVESVAAETKRGFAGTVANSNAFVSLYEQISRSYNQPKPEKQQQSAQSFSNMQPIVILSPTEPSPELQEELLRFGNLYVVCGSPLKRADLARVRIQTAASAIVLANREEWHSAAQDSSTRLSLTGVDTTATATADAPALLSVLNIEALTFGNAEFFLSVEFIHRENMQFVGDTDTLKINEVYGQAFLRPSFMSGRVYAPVMLDTLICQAYYNEHLLEILQLLIFSHGSVAHALGMAKLKQAGFSMDDSEGSQQGSSTHVFLVEIPDRLEGRSYSSLFSLCCFQHNAIAIGLYRVVLHHRQPLWYVMPNPSPDCILREDDRVYLLANSRPDLQ